MLSGTLAACTGPRTASTRPGGCLDRSLAWFRKLNDPLGEATSLLSLGEIYRDQGQLGEAIARFNQCLPVSAASASASGKAGR